MRGRSMLTPERSVGDLLHLPLKAGRTAAIVAEELDVSDRMVEDSRPAHGFDPSA